ncbi:MAG: glycoside hydrolase family 3 C-terminal domain-containing protein [Clostridia bacterium]
MNNIKKLLAELTLEEKASLCSGLTFWNTKPIDRLSIPSVRMTDGPHGLRNEIEGKGGVTNVMKQSRPSTCFPTAVTLASSWDRDLLFKVGQAIAEEAVDQGVSTVLGPGTNIKRSPLCGRNFEYFSEDPYLSGEMATNYVQGVQSKKVGTSLKHFCANNQEHIRMSIDARIDERALREIYLPSFEMTVKRAQPSQIMCSYNRLNGKYLSDNAHLLTEILRNEWGFKGIVVSDWGAVNNRVEGILAGMDLEMPGNGGMNDRNILKAISDGRLSVADLDKVVERILEYVERSYEAIDKTFKCDYEEHHKLARSVASSSAVLLKNDNNILPLNKNEKLTIIGKLADHSRYQGSGSSRINPYKLVSILDALKAENINYEYAQGYNLKGDGYDPKLLKQAVELAKGKDKVVVVIGLTDVYESEGFDRTHMDLPVGHNKLVDEITKVNKNAIVVFVGGSPVTFPWLKNVPALLNLYLGGQAGGEAAVDVLFGAVNPSGKLAETFPKQLKDNICSPYFPMGPSTVEYRESIFVGYRYFDSAKKEVRFPFGFGLSYTNFEYSNLTLSSSKINENDGLSISFTIKNTGLVSGSEIAQVYVKDIKSTVFRPEKELKGFEKVFLQPNESKTITLSLDSRAFAFYNVEISDWCVESGDYEILIGKSSRDLVLHETVNVTSSTPMATLDNYEISCPTYYHISDAKEIPLEEFESLYGEIIPQNKPIERGKFTENSTVGDIVITRLGRFICNTITFGSKLVTRGSENKAMVINSIHSMPLRSFCGFTGGILSQMTVQGLVDMLNKKKGGFKKLRAGFKKENK